MSFKKSLLILLLALTLVTGTLAGCTQTPSDTDTDTTANTAESESYSETDVADTPSITIEAGDGAATVKTGSGLSYTASGYGEVKDGTFGMNNGLLLTFGDRFADTFNRFTIRYVASAPMKITLTYNEKENRIEDVFYLEAGEREFSAVNPKFMQKATCTAIESMKIDTCQGIDANFILLDMSTQTISVPKAQQFITGSRYTLGIDLKWGGAINHVSDTQCPIEGVDNICNKHDEGRLIQQSYYGTIYYADQYVEGGYLGVEGYAYNPVQGGDINGRESRIIDFVIKDDYIYIKAQPLDWILKNSFTPSYMENKYEVKGEYIQVYNRFIDFSGYEHPTLDQELPAVYTVNCLDTFVWYDGGKPWTGDALSTITDWSDINPATNKSSHYIQYKTPNTETWCALIDSETQYGLGIYVPNTDLVLTMRYLSGQKGYKSEKGDPCSYMSPLARIAFKSFEPIEYSYLLAAGTVEQIRETFTENRDFTANEGLNIKNETRAPYVEENVDVTVDFSVQGGLSAINYPRSTEYTFDETEQALALKAVDADPNVTLVFDFGGQQIFAENYGVIEIAYMIPTTNADSSYETQLFLCSGDIAAPTAEVAVTDTLIADGQYHTLQISVRDLDFWSGMIHMIRFDYFSSPTAGDVVYVKALRLVAD